jgi:hypothetical protein
MLISDIRLSRSSIAIHAPPAPITWLSTTTPTSKLAKAGYDGTPAHPAFATHDELVLTPPGHRLGCALAVLRWPLASPGVVLAAAEAGVARLAIW